MANFRPCSNLTFMSERRSWSKWWPWIS